jgi:hypothetical protein
MVSLSEDKGGRELLDAGVDAAYRRLHGPEAQESPAEALRRVVRELTLRDEWVSAGAIGGKWGRAPVCRVRPGRVLHVVGASSMATQLRELVIEGAAPGWWLYGRESAPLSGERWPRPPIAGNGSGEIRLSRLR